MLPSELQDVRCHLSIASNRDNPLSTAQPTRLAFFKRISCNLKQKGWTEARPARMAGCAWLYTREEGPPQLTRPRPPRLWPSAPQNPSLVSPSPCCPELARPTFTCSSASAIAQSESHMTYPEIRENSPCPQPTGKCSFSPNQSRSLSNSHYFSTEFCLRESMYI